MIAGTIPKYVTSGRRLARGAAGIRVLATGKAFAEVRHVGAKTRIELRRRERCEVAVAFTPENLIPSRRAVDGQFDLRRNAKLESFGFESIERGARRIPLRRGAGQRGDDDGHVARKRTGGNAQRRPRHRNGSSLSAHRRTHRRPRVRPGTTIFEGRPRRLRTGARHRRNRHNRNCQERERDFHATETRVANPRLQPRMTISRFRRQSRRKTSRAQRLFRTLGPLRSHPSEGFDRRGFREVAPVRARNNGSRGPQRRVEFAHGGLYPRAALAARRGCDPGSHARAVDDVRDPTPPREPPPPAKAHPAE